MNKVVCGDHTFVPSKVICVGKNFRDHVREMGGDAPPGEPVIFIKPNSAIVASPEQVRVPGSLGLLHHEVELCALIGSSAKDVDADAAGSLIAGWAVGLDLTLRDRQAAAKKAGAPWALSKGFDGAAVLGEFRPADDAGEMTSVELVLSVNGAERQRGSAAEMVFGPASILSFASRFMTLEVGDVVMLGTPAGVGALEDGDRVEASAGDLPGLDFVLTRK